MAGRHIQGVTRMIRLAPLATASAIALLISSATASAQVGYVYPNGYGAYGWNGWGGSGVGTPQGNIARGLGYYAAGEGELVRDTAVADRIEADTVMRWNEYLYESQLEQNRRAYMRETREAERTREAYDMRQRKLLTDPDPNDIERGSALNALFDQISDPKARRAASNAGGSTPVPAALIKDIPFQNSAQAVVLSLNDLTSTDAWPAALMQDDYAEDREAYTRAINQALDEDSRDGKISPQSVQAVRDAVGRIRARFQKNPPQDKAALTDARNYIQTLVGMSRMLDRPMIEKALAELDKVKDTNLTNLVAFMHAYNLRFGPATTPRQREAYSQLYPIMAGFRDRTIGPPPELQPNQTAALPNTVPARRRRPTNFFQGMNFDPPAAPAAPAPGTNGNQPAPRNNNDNAPAPRNKDANPSSESSKAANPRNDQ